MFSHKTDHLIARCIAVPLFPITVLLALAIGYYAAIVLAVK